MNWNPLPETLVAVPATLQLDNGSDRFVVVSTVKEALGLFVNENWIPPLGSTWTAARLGDVPTVAG